MSTVTLPADLGIEMATDLKQTLNPLLAEQGELVLDGSQVTRLHCASVQLLAAFVIARNQQNRVTRLESSPALMQGITLLGLSELLTASATTPSPVH